MLYRYSFAVFTVICLLFFGYAGDEENWKVFLRSQCCRAKSSKNSKLMRHDGVKFYDLLMVEVLMETDGGITVEFSSISFA